MAKTILIVDDSALLRQVVGITLRGAGYEVIEASDGKDGMSKLDGQKIHLIISDVSMPNMDGFTFVKNVKQQASYKFTPILMLSAETGEDMKACSQSVGAKAWMLKPFQPTQMLAVVSKLIMP